MKLIADVIPELNQRALIGFPMKRQKLNSAVATNPTIRKYFWRTEWWKSYHNHVYGAVTIFSLVFTILFYLYPRPPHRTLQSNNIRIAVSFWKLETPSNLGVRSNRIIEHPGASKQLTEWIPVHGGPSPGIELSPGDRLRLSVTTRHAVFAYIFDREEFSNGTLGQPRQIFPTSRIDGGKNEITPGKAFDIPGNQDDPPYFQIRKTNPAHIGDRLIIFAALGPIPEFESGVELSPSKFAQIESGFAPAALDSTELRSATTPSDISQGNETDDIQLGHSADSSQSVYSVPSGTSRTEIEIKILFSLKK